MSTHSQRFAQVWLELAAEGDPAPIAADLVARWTEPQRHYHTLTHLDHCIAGLDTHCALAEHPEELEAALWFHDAVYDPRAADNELRSAALAREVLTHAKVAASRVARVEQLILATRAHETDGATDTALLLDLDLAILGAAPDSYASYADAIRREYVWVPEAAYRQKRAAVLQRFLARPALFLTPMLHQHYEAQARQNLAAEITKLTANTAA